MIFRLFKIYKTGKTIYSRVLKPVYDELKKDAEKLESKEQKNDRTRKIKKNVINQESKRRYQRKANP